MDDIPLTPHAAVTKYVFVSHSSADKKLVEKVVSQIEKRGIRCWISSRDIKPGRDYQQEIVSNLENSAVVLLIFSQHANKSVEILKELSLASKFKKPMIPARTEDIVPSGAFQYQLSNAQIIDLFDNFDKKIQDLCDSITEYMAAKGDQASRPVVAASGSARKSWPLAAGAVALVVAGVSAWAILNHRAAPPIPHSLAASSERPPRKVVASPPAASLVPPPVATTRKLTVGPTIEKQAPVRAPQRAKPSPPPVIERPTLPVRQVAAEQSGAGASIVTRYPAAKIVAWFPSSRPNDAPPLNLLGAKNPVWTVKNSKTGQMRVTILLSPSMVPLDHVVLEIKSGSGTAKLPEKAVISLSGSHSANPDTFRYVSTCSLISPGVTPCDFGSQYARAISVELFRDDTPISDVKFSIGF